MSIGINDQLIGMTVDADQTLHADVQAGLLENLPFTRFSRRLARFHSAARQTPLTVICAACQQDSPIFIKDCRGTAQSDFAFFTQARTVKNLCHVSIPLPITKISAQKISR
jgi:hypothetical protein